MNAPDAVVILRELAAQAPGLDYANRVKAIEAVECLRLASGVDVKITAPTGEKPSTRRDAIRNGNGRRVES